jgi:DNA replication and repair protein RecF
VRITKLRLYRYRNINEVEMSPSAGTTLFFGQNGQGKTNIIEAIYLLGYGKSFRTSTPRDCIQHGQSECRVSGIVEHGATTRDLQVWITPAEKKLFLFGKSATVDQFVGNFHVLAFTQHHLNVVRGGPAERRAFLDRAMVILYPGHMGHLAAYGRALKQRNSILSQALQSNKRADEGLLDSWDETLVQHGTVILWNRLRYIKQMKTELPQGLFGLDVLKIHYLSTIASEDAEPAEIETGFRKRLLEVRQSDRRKGVTSVGPHRDELKLYVNGKPLVEFGSAGQQRSALLSLYFSQMEIHKKNHGYYPVFLVDDAEAELDGQRLGAFLDYLSRRTQTFLTSAKKFFIPLIGEDTARVEVWDGTLIFPPNGR